MLCSLSIRDIVLIEAVDLDFDAGLNVLTGETGAGKSILLDALGFALGVGSGRELLRAGAEQGTVTAVFDVSGCGEAAGAAKEFGLPVESELILRRIASPAGPSRAFVNDQRVSAEALRQIGQSLVEVHGQHDDRGLLNPRRHRALLDAFANAEDEIAGCRAAWRQMTQARDALDEARERIEAAARDTDFLRHAVMELDDLRPEPGEDEQLDAERRLIKRAEKIRDEIARAAELLSADAAEGAMGEALSRLSHTAERAEGRLDATIETLDRAMVEIGLAQRGLEETLAELTFDPGRLEVVEERLFAIRALARKHDVHPDELAALADRFRRQLDEIDDGEAHLAGLERALSDAEGAYEAAAARLSQRRSQAAARLDEAVTAELAPLKMEGARFHTVITEGKPGPEGIDEVSFTAAINPGAPAGPIDRIASGGELSRFLLALKVCLAERNRGRTLVFDEIDRGVGGATADAVGRRLARLAEAGQVLVVTHSPQVAALGAHHWQIAKTSDGQITRTDVTRLDRADRLDEIARMLSGEEVTPEARSAARALLKLAV